VSSHPPAEAESCLSLPNLLDLLTLEPVEHNLFRANTVFDDPHALYGGQVAAQALRAAGLTVEPDRHVHSLHGYFLRPGDSKKPTVLKVFRDRDGRSYSARRVVAIQSGKVIFNMSASFHLPEGGASEQTETMPDAPEPEACAEHDFIRLVSFQARVPQQPFGDRTAWPTRFWARPTVEVPAGDRLLNACVLTYLSDISTGVLIAPDQSTYPGSSLDHAVWFHRVPEIGQWVLADYRPRFTGHGRGWYTGSMFAADGTLLASLTQECLFRPAPPD
jgi:acyl-CoA thioesterase-2